MNTLHFKYALEVAKTGSISQAAENLYMAQPNLSKAIKELEDTLGITIFTRTSRGAEPTEVGSLFLDYARNVLKQIDKMESLKTPKDFGGQVMKIATAQIDYVNESFGTLSANIDTSSYIHLHIKETDSLGVINAIVSGEVDIGLVRIDKTNKQYFVDYIKEHKLKSQLVWNGEKLLLVSKQNPCAKKEMIFSADLRRFTMIQNDHSPVPYVTSQPNETETHYEANEITINDSCAMYEILANMPMAYAWSTPMSPERADRLGLVQRRISDTAPDFEDLIVFPEGYKFTEFEHKFLDILHSVKNAVAFCEYD